MTLYSELKAAGVKIRNWESDLYFESTEVARTILEKYPQQKKIARNFFSEVERAAWIDVPFAYDPFWESRSKPRGPEALA